MRNIALFILVLLLSNCSISSNSKYKSETESFVEMLNAMGTNVQKTNHIYAVFPKLTCKGCESGTYHALLNALAPSDKENITIIYQEVAFNVTPFMGKATIINDSTNAIGELPFIIAGVTFLKFVNGEIVEILKTNTENYMIITDDELLAFIRQPEIMSDL